MIKRRFGFTLSEVLIAMTIIGVISALMVPRITGSVNQKQFATRFKTNVSLLDSAAKEFKSNEGGYDYSGNRSHVWGYMNITGILRNQLGAQLVRGGENGIYNVIGLTYTAECSANIELSEEPCITNLLTNTFQNGTYTKAGATITIPFGKTDDNTNNCWSVMVTTPEDATWVNDKGFPNISCSTRPDSFTVKLNNGAYIFLPKNEKSCNYKNVRWDNDKYLTPDISAEDSDDANINLCMAYLDINGPQGPNRIATCAGSNFLIYPGSNETCNMSKNNVTDVYPLFFYDDSVYPATTAANTVWLDQLAD